MVLFALGVVVGLTVGLAIGLVGMFRAWQGVSSVLDAVSSQLTDEQRETVAMSLREESA